LGGIRKNTRECASDLAANLTDTVTVIDGATNAVTAEVPVGTAPFTPAADSERNIVYVPILFENRVSVIDGATDSVIDTVAVGSLPAGVGVNTSTNRVYVSNLGDNTAAPSLADPAEQPDRLRWTQLQPAISRRPVTGWSSA
jgi:YVTN family beta-propeller protein